MNRCPWQNKGSVVFKHSHASPLYVQHQQLAANLAVEMNGNISQCLPSTFPPHCCRCPILISPPASFSASITQTYSPIKVNLWAVARAGLEASNGVAGGASGSSRSKQAPLGFEHALAVDLTALFGVRGQVGKDGGAKHIALLGNTLAVATDHAVFLLGLSFDVKGKPIFFRVRLSAKRVPTVNIQLNSNRK